MKSLSMLASMVFVVGGLTYGCNGGRISVGADDAGGSDSGHAAPDGATGEPCTTDSDCATNELCGFIESEACSAKGECFASPGAVCDAYSPGCACDGSEITVACTGLPAGYASKPLEHTGACATDGGSGGGGVCTSDSDCASGEACGFPEAAGCAATGQCFKLPEGECQAYSPGCACDGTEINLACNGFPSGFATRPLAHSGACGPDAGGVSSSSCTTSADCVAQDKREEICGFAVADACNAKGECFVPAPLCKADEPACSCSGEPLNLVCSGLPSGYTTAPFEAMGACGL